MLLKVCVYSADLQKFTKIYIEIKTHYNIYSIYSEKINNYIITM